MPFARRASLVALLFALLPILHSRFSILHAQPRLEALGIEVRADSSRPFVVTDKGAAYFYGEAAGPQRTAWQGFNVRGVVVVDDWRWETPAGPRGAADLAAATVWPDVAERRYRGGLSERVTLLDAPSGEGAALLIEPAGAARAIFRPLLADGRDPAFFDTRAAGNVLLVARRNRPARRTPADAPVWLAVAADGARAEVLPGTVESGGVDGPVFSPGRLVLPAATPVVLAVGDTPEAATANARAALADRAARTAARRARMQAALDTAFVTTGDDRFNRALAWARLSLDALVMNQRGRGIFAGLPWFNTYWGRDSFISVPGALLVTGEWETAADVLRAFAAFQDTTATSPTFGRLPNTVSLESVAYNTADGTLWYAIQAAAMLRRAADPALHRDLWPVVRRAVEGELRRADRDGFVRHGDQETWMDAAAGPGQEWSPRGDRASDVQGLFYEALRAAADLATEAGARDASARADAARYRAHADRLRTNFLRVFAAPLAAGGFVDHLNPDGSKDRQLRPNALFALHSFGVPDSLAQPRARRLAEALVYPWGVASLAQTDPAFHPYHEAPDLYPKDAAYHNGTVWTWLAGPLVRLMARQGAPDLAYEQTRFLTHLALDRGAVGTMPENLDALPHPGESEPRLTGAVSQAWTLAEFVRTAFEDYAGVRYEAPTRVVVEPHLPAAWGPTTVRFRVEDGHVVATLQHVREGDAEALDAVFEADAGVPAGATVEVRGAGARKRVPLRPGGRIAVRLVREARGAYVVTNALVDGVTAGIDARVPRPRRDRWDSFRWAAPRSLDGIPALRGPDHPLLTRADVKATGGAARTRLAVTAPAGDDRGPAGTYTYPAHPAFAPGILDATGLTIREDADRWYFDLAFRALTQPGWNPHYGFQLTFAALLLGRGGGPKVVPRDARYPLPEGYRYAVFVGGGLRVEDGAGRVLAEYRPAEADASDPLGSASTGRITFALPKSILPSLPAGMPVTLLVGGQDDHGGAGIGDFRAVGAARTEWAGGGKTDPAAPNVYDVVWGVLGR